MNTIMRLAAVLAASSMVAACVTSPTPSGKAQAVSADRVFAYQAKPAGSDFGTVVVTRDTGMKGALAAVTISIDGTRAASLKSGERVTLYVPSGDHIISSQFVSSRKDRELILKAGQAKFYRVSIDSIVGTMDLQPTLDQ